jgi:hypothetical protein
VATDYNMTTGMNFYVLSDKYSTITIGFSVITIYTSVILVIGNFLRQALSGDLELLIQLEQPYADDLLRICDAIAIART